MFSPRRRINKPAAIMAVPSVFFLLISIFGFSTSAQAASFPNAGFEDGTFAGWEKGTQTGTLGTTITGNGTGVTIFTGSRTFTHGSRGAVGSPTKQDGSANPYYAPAVSAGSWTFGPNNAAKAVALQPVGQITFSDAMTALGLSGSPQTAIQAQLTADSNASGFGSPTPTNAAWITREVQLTAGETYTMSWNYLGTDYVPYNDGSVTALVPVTVTGTPVIRVNNYVQSYALLGFTNPGTGDYSTNSYGATGWQTSTYRVDITGTYKLGFAVFNLGDTSLSPVLMVDSEAGSTERCISGTCTTFGGVEPNNETAPTVAPTTTSPATTTSTTSTTTTTLPPAPTSIEVTSLLDDGSSGTLRWAINQANENAGGIYDAIDITTEGTITLTSDLPNITAGVTITGTGIATTIIDGNNLYRAIYNSGARTIVIEDMTFKQGKNVSWNGGLIYNSNGTMTFNRIKISNHSSWAFYQGGGGVTTFNDSQFVNNGYAITSDHGGTPSSLSLTDTDYSNRIYINDSLFTSNQYGIRTERFVKIDNSQFTGNTGVGAYLGGLNRQQVLNSSFTSNGVGVSFSSWIPTSWTPGADNQTVSGNTFNGNTTAIQFANNWNNGSSVYNGVSANSFSTSTGNTFGATAVNTANYSGTGYVTNNDTIVAPYFNAVQNLTATANNDGSVFLDWDAPTSSNTAPYMYNILFYDLVNGQETSGWGVWTYAANTSYTLGSGIWDGTTGYGPVRFKIQAGTAPCVGEANGSCLYGPQVSANATVIEPTSVTTTTSTTTTTTTTIPVEPEPEPGTTTTQPVVIVVPVEPEPESIYPEDTTPATEETLPEETETEETLPDTEDETLPSETETETESGPLDEPSAEAEEIQDAIDDLPIDASPDEIAELVGEALIDATAEEVAEVLSTIFEDATDEEVVAILSAVFEDATSEDIVAILSETFTDGATDEQVAAVTEALLSDGATEEAVSTLIDVLESGVIDESQVEAVVEAILSEEISDEAATELATSAAVIQNITAEQATDIFASVPVGELSDSEGAEIVAAVQDAPTEVKESFEEEINVFSGVFDTYVPLDSTIDVGTRRSVIAVNLVTSTVALASAAGGLPTPSSSTSAPKQDMAARKPEEEEAEEGGAIEGEGPEWIKRISIYKYEDGVKVMDWKNFARKFVYGIMASGFTLAGATVMYFTLSGLTQQIALWGTLLAFTGSMYLHMKEPDSD